MMGASGHFGRGCASHASSGLLTVLGRALFVCAWMLQIGVAPARAAGAADTVEQDAQAYSRLAMRHDILLLKLNLKRATPQEEQEMDSIRAEGAAIKSKYAPGGSMASQAAAFEKRLKELSEQVVQPGIKAAVADAFPSVDEIVAAYPDPAHSIAALRILEQMMLEKVGKPSPSAATAKLDAYHAAITKLDVHSDVRGASEKLERSREFQFEVLDRFVPIYAGDAGFAVSKERYEARAGAEEQQIYRAYALVFLIVLALPLLYLLRGQRAGAGAKPGKDDAYPFQLPPQLRRLSGFRATYFPRFDCGVVTDKRELRETTEYTTETQDRTLAGQIQIFGTPKVSTWSSTTVRNKYVLRAPDDRIIRREYLSGVADAEIGQVVSSVDMGGWVVAWQNHSLDTRGAIADNIEHLNRMPSRLLWVASVVVAFIGLWSVQRFLVEAGTHADDWRFAYMVGSLTLLAAIVSAVSPD